jgi:hypothetical protein
MIYYRKAKVWLIAVIFCLVCLAAPQALRAQLVLSLHTVQDNYKHGDEIVLKLMLENQTSKPLAVCQYGPACIDRAWVSRDGDQSIGGIPPIRTVTQFEQYPLPTGTSWIRTLNPGENTSIWFPVLVDFDGAALLSVITTLVDKWYCVPGGAPEGIHEPAYSTEIYRLYTPGQYHLRLEYFYKGAAAKSNKISFSLE